MLQDGGGPLRYIGPRDTNSLLDFMNVHCRALTVGAKPLRLENSKTAGEPPSCGERKMKGLGGVCNL
jgi:hypothetical protein